MRSSSHSATLYTQSSNERKHMAQIEFTRINEQGEITEVRTLSSEAVKGCSFFILDPEHYRDSGTCRCDDPDHEIMDAWGYLWNEATERWEA